MVVISLVELHTLATKNLIQLNYKGKDLEIVRDVLLYAQLRGNTQGLVKLVTKGVLTRHPQETQVTIEAESNSSARLNGGKCPGMVVMQQATELAIDKAREQGISIVTTHNTGTSTGAIGYYVNKIARQGFIGIAMSGSHEMVAPYGSKDPLFGTNPIAVGFPSEHDPMVMDFATSAISLFGIILAKIAGESLPENVTIDKDGYPTTDPEAALAGAILPFDRAAKGSALSLMVELFCGPLAGGAIENKKGSQNSGNVVIAINPTLFYSAPEFRHRVQLLLNRVKGGAKMPNVDEVYLPGERGANQVRLCQKRHQIELEDNLYQQLQANLTARL